MYKIILMGSNGDIVDNFRSHFAPPEYRIPSVNLHKDHNVFDARIFKRFMLNPNSKIIIYMEEDK